MSDSIYSLIQEKRKLFYRGILKNKYKDQINNENKPEQTETYQAELYVKNRNLRARSLNILQEIFSD